VIRRIADWIRRIGRTQRPSGAQPRTTFIDRRIWALGYVPNDEKLIAKARQIQGELELARRELRNLPPDQSSVGVLIRRYLLQVDDFLHDPTGKLAREINRWPGDGGHALSRVLDEAEALIEMSGEATEMNRIRVEVNGNLVQLERQFSRSVPNLWACFHGPAGLSDQLQRAPTLGRLIELSDSTEDARTVLQQYSGQLHTVEDALKSAVARRGIELPSELIRLESLEDRVKGLTDHVEEDARALLKESLESIDAVCAQHLAHLKVRTPSREMRGKRHGSVMRGLARHGQLAAAAEAK